MKRLFQILLAAAFLYAVIPCKKEKQEAPEETE